MKIRVEEDFLEGVREEVFDFVLMRRKEEGGFAATPRLPATVEDTYFALRIWDLLGGEAPEVMEAVRTFLERTSPEGQPPVLRRWVWMARRVGLLAEASVRKRVERVLVWWRKRAPEDPEVLASLRDCARVLGVELDIPSGFCAQRVRTLRELFWVSRLFGRVPGRGWISWIVASRNPDGGFGFRPGTTSFLENVYFALRTLALAGEVLPEPERTLRFVEGCYRRGGFARAPGGIPFLETTYYGVYLLKKKPALVV